MTKIGVRCPSCASTSVRLKTPASCDLLSYQCNSCGREWSEHTSDLQPEPLDTTPTEKDKKPRSSTPTHTSRSQENL
jgi:hypothetical protein